MIRFLENLAISVERNLKNTQVAFRIYSVIFTLCILIFGFLGIGPLSRILIQKIQISRELEKSYATLQSNLVNAQQAEKDILENKQKIDLLSRYMPQDTNVQSYMLDFLDSIAPTGFALKYFTQNNIDETVGRVELSISMEGTEYPANMVKNIEALKRVTQLTRLNMYKNSRGILTITLDLNIFTAAL